MNIGIVPKSFQNVDKTFGVRKAVGFSSISTILGHFFQTAASIRVRLMCNLSSESVASIRGRLLIKCGFYTRLYGISQKSNRPWSPSYIYSFFCLFVSFKFFVNINSQFLVYIARLSPCTHLMPSDEWWSEKIHFLPSSAWCLNSSFLSKSQIFSTCFVLPPPGDLREGAQGHRERLLATYVSKTTRLQAREHGYWGEAMFVD